MGKKDKYFSEDLWCGGYFELLLCLPNGKKQQIYEIISSIGQNSRIVGFYQKPEEILVDTKKFSPKSVEVRNENQLYGEITILNGDKLPFEVSTYDIEQIIFFSLRIPVGALSELSKLPLGNYSSNTKKENQFINDLSEFFLDIAKDIFIKVKFATGGIGFVAGIEDEIADIDLRNVPKKRWIGYLINDKGELRWFPPNIFKGPIAIVK